MPNSSRLRAAWVVPVAGEPIPDGEVVIEGGRVAEVRPVRGLPVQDAHDFGDAIILPGLINVHTHLDYTVMRGLLEDIEFFPWIRALTARKAVLTQDDWEASAACGAAEAVAAGVTTIGDCTDSGAALYGAKSLGLGGVVYQEVFGIDESMPVDAILKELQSKVDNLSRAAEGTALEVGISPHAPYTVRPELMSALAVYARENRLKICIHASESQAEAELIRSGTGPIKAMFDRRGITWTHRSMGAANYLAMLGILGPNTLLVHGVQLAAEERAALEEAEVAWAHCPKSNAKLGNGVADITLLGLEAARKAGRPARIGLGSDSVASNNSIDMFEEMRFAVLMQRGARRKISVLGAADVVEMATMGGALALAVQTETGSLVRGKRADICIVDISGLHASPAYDPYSALVYASRASDVLTTIVAGEAIYDARMPDYGRRFLNFDIDPARLRLRAAAQKLRDWRSTD